MSQTMRRLSRAGYALGIAVGEGCQIRTDTLWDLAEEARTDRHQAKVGARYLRMSLLWIERIE